MIAEVYRELLARQGEAKVEPRLDATARAARLLGDVHTAAPVISVVGTNGKTSVSRILDSLLSAHGLRVGRFTSPHLRSVTERIALDGVPVPEETFERIYREIEPYLALVDAELESEGRARLTFFEALTVLAFAVFADAPVDVVVLEAGMGGEWDSTNVADATVAVFTPIDLDHQGILGDTVEEIAATKAGILRRTVDPSPAPRPFVAIGRQSPAVLKTLEPFAAESALAAFADRDFEVTERERAVDGQVVTISTQSGGVVYEDLFLGLHGSHQAENAALALAATELFLVQGQKALDQELVSEAFAAVSAPGRAEVVRSSPTVVVDGAHNPAGAAVLAATLGEAFSFPSLVGVVGMLRGKDAEGFLAALERDLDEVIVTEPVSERALPVDELAGIAREVFGEDRVTIAASIQEALLAAVEAADRAAESSGGLAPGGVVVTGSLVTVGQARTLLGADDAEQPFDTRPLDEAEDDGAPDPEVLALLAEDEGVGDLPGDGYDDAEEEDR